MGKITILFLAIFVACLLGYITVWALIGANPEFVAIFGIILFPLGIGMLVGIVGTVVGFILKK